MAELQGLKEMQAAIADLNRELAAALPDIVMQGAEVVEQEIATRAPVYKGDIVRNIDATPEASVTGAAAIVQVGHSGPDGAAHEAIFSEFGTAHQQAKPFFRPGVQAAADKVREQITRGIEQIIERQT